MAQSYRPQVASALEVLAEGLAPFIDSHMSRYLDGEDWIVTAATRMGRPEPVLAAVTDPQFQLEVMVRWWGPVFAKELPRETRDTVQYLRQARNEWAHIGETSSIDYDFAQGVYNAAGDLLREVGSPLATDLGRLEHQLRFDQARDVAAQDGISENDVLLKELEDLQAQRADLQDQLVAARDAAQSADGQRRAVARQLADLQTQYAAVSGLREQYELLLQELEAAERRADASVADTSEVRQQLHDAQAAIASLHESSDRLHGQLADARTAIDDPIRTEAGRRWLMLVAALVMVLGLAVILAFARGAAL